MNGMDADFVQQFTTTLDRTERYILTLHYCEQLTFEEIGLVLDLAAVQVAEMLDRLRDRTRAALEAWQGAATFGT